MPDTAIPPVVVEVDPGKLPGTFAEIKAAIHRAQKGDESAVPLVRKYLAVGGADALGGNLAERAAEILLAVYAGQNLLTREATAKKMAELRAELGGPNPSAVERLLAERAVCCWLHLAQVEAVYAAKGSMTLTLADHYQKSIDRAHKRYLSALKALAEVRKIGVTIQLNIARKQVNVAGAAVPANQ